MKTPEEKHIKPQATTSARPKISGPAATKTARPTKPSPTQAGPKISGPKGKRAQLKQATAVEVRCFKTSQVEEINWHNIMNSECLIFDIIRYLSSNTLARIFNIIIQVLIF